jgi:hypothetical protein
LQGYAVTALMTEQIKDWPFYSIWISQSFL